VVCTQNRPTELKRCLESLAKVRYPLFEILVVDNASSDSAALNLAREHGARYIYDPVPGLSHARNVGARVSRGDIVAYLDDDAVADPNWLEALASEFEDPDVAAVVGRCLPLKIDTEAERVWTKLHGPNWGSEHRVLVGRNSPGWFTTAIFGDLGIGANMAFRRTAFEVWPGFDERLGRGMPLDGNEENYAFFSLVRLGYKLVAAPGAVVKHPHPPTMEALLSSRIKHSDSLAGFLCLLLVEEKGHRLETLKFIVGRFRNRTPQKAGTSSALAMVSPLRLLLSHLRGPWLYVLSSWKLHKSRESSRTLVPFLARALSEPQIVRNPSVSRLSQSAVAPPELRQA
jgi:glycosyltransferase involved in cell wall biosynthesis